MEENDKLVIKTEKDQKTGALTDSDRQAVSIQSLGQESAPL